MINTRLIPIALACLFASHAFADDHAIMQRGYSPAESFKNFALSQCVANGFQQQADIQKDAQIAAGGYLEIGHYPIEAYEEAVTLSKQFLAREYRTMAGQSLTLMKCIDLYHSDELAALVEKYEYTLAHPDQEHGSN